MILNDTYIWVIIVAHILIYALLGHFYKYNIRRTVPNLEAAKLELGPVVGQFAEESVSRLHQRLHVLSRAILRIRMRLRLLVIIIIFLSYV